MADDKPVKLLVRHLPRQCSCDLLKIYFENRKTFNGKSLEVKSVDPDDVNGSAVVTFNTASDVEVVLAKHKQQPCKLCKQELHIEVYEDPEAAKPQHEYADEPEELRDNDSRTIEVRGFNEDTSDDTIEFYFENANRSGGGDIETCIVDREAECAHVTFKHKDVVKRVLQRSHALSKCTLNVKLFITSKTEMLLSGIPEGSTKENIENFIEAKLKTIVLDVVYNASRNKAIVKCENIIDFERATTICEKYKVDGVNLKLGPVPITNSVKVTNIAEASTEDTYRFYFENVNRSSGGDVADVKLHAEEGYCLVHFKDIKCVDTVCKQTKHMVQGKQLKIEPYHACLGHTFGSGETKFNIPESITLSQVEPYKQKFLMRSPSKRKGLSNILKKYSAEIVWESQPIRIECLLTKDMKDCRTLANTWTDQVNVTINDFICDLNIQKAKVPEEFWEDTIAELGKVEISQPDEIVVIAERENELVIVVGHKQIIDFTWQHIKGVIETVQKEIRQKRESVTEEKMIDSWKVQYLLAFDFVERMKRTYGNVNTELDMMASKIKLIGPRSEVTNVLLKMHELVAGVQTKRIHLEVEYIELLKNKDILRTLKQTVKVCSLDGVWEIEDGVLILHGYEEKILNTMENVIMNLFAKIDILLDQTSSDILLSSEWQQTVEKLQRKYCGRLIIKEYRNQPNSLKIFTLADIKDNIEDEVRHIVSDMAVYTEEINLDPIAARFMKVHMKGDVDQKVEDARQRGVRIKIKFGKANNFSIEGTLSGIKEAKQIVQTLTSRLTNRQHQLNKPGIKKYIASESGLECIKKIENNNRCVIEVVSSGFGKTAGRGQMKHPSRFNQPTVCAKVSLKSGIKIVVIGGDITSLDADVIVNAANQEMKHVGGLAALIVKKGGQSIQQECNDRIGNKGRMDIGDVFVSKAGFLANCQAIAHAVGPSWSGGKKGEERLLEKAVRKSLEKTEKGKFVSIALPALSAGMFGYPVDQSCLVIVKTIQQHFTGWKSSIKKVYLCDINEATVHAFVKALEKVVGGVEIHEKLDKGMTVPKSTFRQKSRSSDETVEQTLGNISVTVVQALVVKERVDVIVNSTSADLVLNKGISSKALLRAGGDKIQKECKQNYPQGISVGDVAITTGGKLNCQKVFHIALQPYDGSMQGLSTCMKACLKEAHNAGFTSISFPALGTGSQKYPKDKVASEMFGSIATFWKQHPGSTIKKIRFVIYTEDDDTFEAFITEEKNWTEQEWGYGGGARKSTTRDHVTPGIGNVVSVSNDKAEFQIDCLKVFICQGDITEEDTDAIVASCNRELDLTKGAVTKYISKKGGPGIDTDCQNEVSKMRRKGIVIIPGGLLQCNHIILVDTKRKTHEWQPVVLACLQKAEKHSLTSLSIPALGTSVGCKPGDIAEVMYVAMVEFLKCKPSNVREIRVVVFKKEMLAPFINSMKSSVEGKGHRYQRFSGTQSFRRSDAGSSRQGEDACVISICTDSLHNINKAIKQIESTVKSEWTVKEIQDSAVHALNKHQMDDIKQTANDNGVNIEIDMDLGVITLQGLTQNIIPINDKIYNCIRKQEKSISERRHAQLMKNVVSWLYLKDQKEFPFPTRANLTIETAYQKKETSVNIKDGSGGEYQIDFAKMHEFDIKQPQTTFPLIRRDLVSGGTAVMEIPQEWTAMKSGQNMLLVQLQSGSPEYNTVVQHFAQTLGRQPNIIQIDRVQNATLYTQYVAKRKQMINDNPHRNDNERILWHGTAPTSIPSINAHGFNRSYCGGGSYGLGVYFATNASYSDGGYARPDAAGHKRMYRSRVLTGDFTTGNSSWRMPPAKNALQPHILFDSVVDNPAGPGMYIVFNDTQAYPEHLITYT